MKSDLSISNQAGYSGSSQSNNGQANNLKQINIDTSDGILTKAKGKQNNTQDMSFGNKLTATQVGLGGRATMLPRGIGEIINVIC